MESVVRIEGLRKSFVLHAQGRTSYQVLSGLDLEVFPGECVMLSGPSGSGKSSLLRCIYGNYSASGGRILVRHEGSFTDMASATEQTILSIRCRTMGHVSQFLRVIPRVPAIECVAEPLLSAGVPEGEAKDRAAVLLSRLRIPRRLWGLSPTTFSGGEQQRVNIARGFALPYPVLLLDEPTASLDSVNKDTVIGLVRDARDRGAAIIGAIHDAEASRSLGTRFLEFVPFEEAPA